MPFISEKQRRWMFANKPAMAKRWSAEYGSTPVKGATVKGNVKQYAALTAALTKKHGHHNPKKYSGPRTSAAGAYTTSVGVGRKKV